MPQPVCDIVKMMEEVNGEPTLPKTIPITEELKEQAVGLLKCLNLSLRLNVSLKNQIESE